MTALKREKVRRRVLGMTTRLQTMGIVGGGGKSPRLWPKSRKGNTSQRGNGRTEKSNEGDRQHLETRICEESQRQTEETTPSGRLNNVQEAAANPERVGENRKRGTGGRWIFPSRGARVDGMSEKDPKG